MNDCAIIDALIKPQLASFFVCFHSLLFASLLKFLARSFKIVFLALLIRMLQFHENVRFLSRIPRDFAVGWLPDRASDIYVSQLSLKIPIKFSDKIYKPLKMQIGTNFKLIFLSGSKYGAIGNQWLPVGTIITARPV